MLVLLLNCIQHLNNLGLSSHSRSLLLCPPAASHCSPNYFINQSTVAEVQNSVAIMTSRGRLQNVDPFPAEKRYAPSQECSAKFCICFIGFITSTFNVICNASDVLCVLIIAFLLDVCYIIYIVYFASTAAK